MEKKKKIWITAMAVVIGAAGYGVYKIQDNRKREAAYQSAKDSLVLKLEENPTIECGTEIEDMNTLALSYVKEAHGDLSVKGTDSIDPKKVGEGELTYTVSTKDAYGVEVSKEETLQVKVIDTQAPEITLVHESVNLTVGDEFDPLANVASVKDKADGEMDKATVEVDNPVDMTKPGEYTVTVTVKDSADNTETKTYAVAVYSKQAVMANRTGVSRRGASRNTASLSVEQYVENTDGTAATTGGNTDPWDTINGGIFDNEGKVNLADGNARFGEGTAWGAWDDADGNVIQWVAPGEY
ncbi:MAG: immunoglobulin-like domain-containing protein [Bulleidia sp.]